MFGTRIRSFQTCGGRGSGRCAPQIEKPFEIPGDRDQGPFTGSRVQSTQVELTKTQRGFDNPVYGFYRAFAQRVDGASFYGGQAVVHRFDDIRIRSQRGWFGKTRFHWRMMVLACASNVGSNLSGIAGAVVFDSLASRRCAFDLDY